MITRLGVITGFVGTLVASLCAAQGSPARPLWGDLASGPYEVGFRVVYRLDRSRVWEASPDSVLRSDFARPIRISLWYPARHPAGGRAMLYSDYVHFAPPNAYFARVDSLLVTRETNSWQNAFKGSGRSVQDLLNLPVVARMDASASDGIFPLVVYSEGWNSSSQNDNSVLSEFLASHGYVVAAVPQLGTSSTSLTLGLNPIDLETQMRDVEFAMGIVQEQPFVDNRKLALMGWSMGGVVSLWLAARNPNVDAVVGLDASFRARDFVTMVLASPYFDIRQIRAPLLALQSGNTKYVGGQDDRVIDSLHFAERLVGRVANITHGDFSDFAMVAKLFPLHLEDRTAAQASRGHVAIAATVLGFLDAVFRGKSSQAVGLQRLADGRDSAISLEFHDSAKIPSEVEWVAMLDSSGFDRTLVQYERIRSSYPTLAVIRYATLNRLGYSLRDNGKLDLAVAAFRLNAAAHPTLADAYDSLADGYLAKGDSASARRAYQQVLNALDSDASLSASSRENYKSRAEQYIRSHPASAP
jgi:dienelactone hydrolase